MESADVSGICKICKRNLQTMKEFRNSFFTEYAYAIAEFKGKDLTIVSENHEQILHFWLTKSIDVTL